MSILETKEELESRARDWWRLFEQASCKEHVSHPVLSDEDLHYIAKLLNTNTRMKWLIPVIIETAINEGYWETVGAIIEDDD